MEFVTLGKTNLLVSRSALGTRRLELVSPSCALSILDSAYQSGINFYEVCLQSLGCADSLASFLYDKRKNCVLSVSSLIQEKQDVVQLIEGFLDQLTLDYIDIFSIKTENEFFDENSDIYKSLKSLKEKGKIHFIGFHTHNLSLAEKARDSNLYEVIQYPLNLLSSDEEIEFVSSCQKKDLGFMARMPFNAGKIDNVPLAFGFLRQFENVIPVYSAGNDDEIQKLVYFEMNPPVADERFKEDIVSLRKSC
ncbi:MAG: aldo/keto reductase [Treponemataceae bacterium]|nr:aldo/keto reductase [Treponemataceae bacterium]